MGLFGKLFGSSKNDPSPVQNTHELMEEDQFWNILSTSISKSNDDYEMQQEALRNELQKLSPLDILKFDNKFRILRGTINTWDFWAAAYIMNGGCSDDSFLDFRGWLIGQGKTTYYNALKDINSLTRLTNFNNGDWEGLGYIASEVFEEMTEEEIPMGITENTETTGTEWDEEGDDLKNRYPKLWETYGDT